MAEKAKLIWNLNCWVFRCDSISTRGVCKSGMISKTALQGHNIWNKSGMISKRATQGYNICEKSGMIYEHGIRVMSGMIYEHGIRVMSGMIYEHGIRVMSGMISKISPQVRNDLWKLY